MTEQPALIADLTRRGLRVDAGVQVDIDNLDHSLATYAEAVNSTPPVRDVAKPAPRQSVGTHNTSRESSASTSADKNVTKTKIELRQGQLLTFRQ